jgi:hypothetical protein
MPRKRVRVTARAVGNVFRMANRYAARARGAFLTGSESPVATIMP